MPDLSVWLATGLAVVLLALIAIAALAGARVAHPFSALTAIVRAAIQLALLSLVLAGIINDPLWVGVGLAVMFVAAVLTAVRRANTGWSELGPHALAMFVGLAVVGVIAFGTGAIAFSPRYVLAIGGIVIGNTMTIAILTDRIFHNSVRDNWPEVEGWLALGATPRQSTTWLGRSAIQTALLPSIDQTRTTGIVVLPGAFVGAIFAGASPLEAGRFQLVVLASILAAGAITATLLTRFIANVRTRPLVPDKSGTP